MLPQGSLEAAGPLTTCSRQAGPAWLASPCPSRPQASFVLAPWGSISLQGSQDIADPIALPACPAGN